MKKATSAAIMDFDIFEGGGMTKSEVSAKAESRPGSKRTALMARLKDFRDEYLANGFLGSEVYYPVVKYTNRETAVTLARKINRYWEYKASGSTDALRYDFSKNERWSAYVLKDEGPTYVVRIAIYDASEK